MLRPPEPCPWETACAECAERVSCSAWLDYAEQARLLQAAIIEDERSNLVREALARARDDALGVPARVIIGHRARSFRAPR